ncbi:alginate lyase family protein [Terrabacter sp. NPDC080008]|uniref:alginate lyase family protein n=1 Tax=Terrabacter sp. NPDC080008 TaxID=3155176 RepID=UPI00344DA50D
MSRSLGWYADRLRRMPPHEVAARVGDRRRQLTWRRRWVRPEATGWASGPVPGVLPHRSFDSTVPASARDLVPASAREALVAAADGVLAGDVLVLGHPRPDLADPDWFLDPASGRRAPQSAYAFSIDHRDEAVTGNVKLVWELSRHHHLTVLAAAWWLTGDERYAVATAAQLRSWWAANPFLSGVHWTSGIELGIRLLSWVWVRRLLEGWPGAPALFEDNAVALHQIRWHQEHLAAFRSTGSSANNHLVAEACGRLAAACAFPWFAESARWRTDAARELEASLEANTFPSGVNREQASDYHRFVTELALLGLAEADRSGRPLSAATKRLVAGSVDAAAALLDPWGRPPRQGDGDEGRGLVADGVAADPWLTLLATGAAVFGALEWWPRADAGVTSVLVGALADPCVAPDRPAVAPAAFPDAGIHLLRAVSPEGEPLLWCRCDGGPQGFLSIAAHGHADALALEVRSAGVDLLVDPGTYCYHGEPQWRSYFRSTRAHNTVEVDGVSQAVEGGPFLWTTHADAEVDRAGEEREADGRRRQVWVAHHTAYARLDAQLRHTRHVTVETCTGELVVVDTLTGGTRHSARLSWHLGPEVTVALQESVAHLSWPGTEGRRQAWLQLPEQLEWTVHRGRTDPVAGWYSPWFGERVPTTTLVGVGDWTGVVELRTALSLDSRLEAAGETPETAQVALTPELALGGNVPPRVRELP